MKTIKYTLIPFFCVQFIYCNAQRDVAEQSFYLSFNKHKTGGKIEYKITNHTFSVDIIGDNIQQVANSNYFTIGDQVLQTSIVELPPNNLNLENLSLANQKEALFGYVFYETGYFKNELKLTIENLKTDLVTLNKRTWIIWTFESKTPLKEKIKTSYQYQIYASTICYNQIFTLNLPLENSTKSSEKLNLLEPIMKTLELKKNSN